MSRIRVFVGASLDGFIAGPNDELACLGEEAFPDFSEQMHHERRICSLSFPARK